LPAGDRPQIVPAGLRMVCLWSIVEENILVRSRPIGIYPDRGSEQNRICFPRIVVGIDVMAGIEELMRELSPEHRREALDFVAYLLLKQKRKQGIPLRQTWAGALRRYRDTYTALDLQKESLTWRTE